MFKQIVDITDGRPKTRGLSTAISIGTALLKMIFAAAACSLFGWKIGELVDGDSGSSWGWTLGAIGGAVLAPFFNFSKGEGLSWKPEKLITLPSEVKLSQEEAIESSKLSSTELFSNVFQSPFLSNFIIISMAFLGFFGSALVGLIWMAIAYSPWADDQVFTPEVASGVMGLGPLKGAGVGLLVGFALKSLLKKIRKVT